MDGDFRKELVTRPELIPPGQPAFVVKRRWIKALDERAIVPAFVSDRPLFGATYDLLQSDCFRMPEFSGVFVTTFLPTNRVVPDAKLPGDIDVLVIPYTDSQLLLDKTLAIETKVIRASFIKQGKSPNKYGFRQATGLLNLGFPFVAVIHLITSDQSPRENWQEALALRTTCTETGEAESLGPVTTDLMPADLMERSFGRLRKNQPIQEIGLASVYPSKPGTWLPYGQRATKNQKWSAELLNSVYEYFCENTGEFFDNPKYHNREAG